MSDKTFKKVPFSAILRRLNNSTLINEEQTYRCAGVCWYGKGAFVRETEIGMNIVRKKQWIVRAGNVIYNKLFAWKGAFAVADKSIDGCIVSDKFPIYEHNPDLIDLDYLRYYFQTSVLAESARRLSKGAAAISKLTLNPPDFLKLEIPLPTIEEQKKIVHSIDKILSRIEEAKRFNGEAVKKAEQLLLSTYSEVFSDMNIMKHTKKVADICTHPQYGYTESAKQEPVGPKFLRITDIQNGLVNWDKVPYCMCWSKDKYLLRFNDILFARCGATTGKSFLVNSPPPEAVFASYLIRIRATDGVLPEYLYEFFQSPIYWSQVSEGKKGSALPNMNGQKLLSLEVPLPDSAEIQNQIVLYLTSIKNKVNELRELHTLAQKKMEDFIPSVLNQVFQLVETKGKA